jgi:hypothetical protein
MTEPHYEVKYEEGPKAGYVDWVAGGNFDGYIYQKSISFKKTNNEVVINTVIIDDSRYDGEVHNSEVVGQYEYTDTDTITVKYGELTMRGKILGKNKEYIVFSVFHAKMERWNEVYELKPLYNNS